MNYKTDFCLNRLCPPQAGKMQKKAVDFREVVYINEKEWT